MPHIRGRWLHVFILECYCSGCLSLVFFFFSVIDHIRWMTCVYYYCIHFIGLPPRYRDSVRAITPGLPLFLYNYTTHQLHGIFEVCSHLFLFIAFISFEILLVVQGVFSVRLSNFLQNWLSYHIFLRYLIKRPQFGFRLFYFHSFDGWGNNW